MTEWPKKTLTGLKAAEHPVCIQNPQTGIYPLQPLLYDVWKGPLLPWQMENDLGPLDMSQEVPQVSIEEAIEKIENLHHQVLEVAAGNIKKVQAHQAKTYNTKHARNDFEVGAKVWKKNPLWNTKQKSLKKGPNARLTHLPGDWVAP